MRTSSQLALVVCAFVTVACEGADPERTPIEADESVCYDHFDNDEDGATDCGDSGCAEFATCCVGSGSVSCCEPLDRVYWQSWASCTTTVGECAPGMEVVGDPLPILVDGAVAATNEAEFPSGVILEEPFDPLGSNLRIVFEASAPTCLQECYSNIAFGLTGVPFRIGTFPIHFALTIDIRPSVDGDDGGFILAWGREIGRFSVPDAALHKYAFDLQADGTATVLEVDDAGETLRVILDTFEVDLPDPVHLVIAGQQVSAGAGDVPGRVRSVYVDRGVCDMPQRAFPGASPVIAPTAEGDLVSIDGVGRAKNAAGLEAVIVAGTEAFYFFESDGADGYQPVGETPTPVLTAAMLSTIAATRITAPWLVADEDAGVWQLYFTAWTGEATSVIARLSGTANFGFGFDASSLAVVVVGNSEFPAVTDATVLDDTMVVRNALSGIYGDGSLSLLSMLRKDTEGTWSYFRSTLAESIIHRPAFGTGAFDKDEVSTPALVRLNGAMRLYYGGRKGTRRSMGLLVSDTGEGWHKLNGDDPIWPRPASGFGFIWTHDPAPWVEDGRVVMLYLGHDGVRSWVGRATSGSPRTWPSVDPYPE